jgi:hypothetical protein
MLKRVSVPSQQLFFVKPTSSETTIAQRSRECTSKQLATCSSTSTSATLTTTVCKAVITFSTKNQTKSVHSLALVFLVLQTPLPLQLD